MIREEEEKHFITVEVQYRAISASCPRCGQRTPKVHSVSKQNKRDRGLWNKVVYLVLHKRRFRCLGCKKVFSEPDPVFGARRRSSQRFRQYLGQEAIHQTIRHTARKEMVGEGSGTALSHRGGREVARSNTSVRAQPGAGYRRVLHQEGPSI